MSAAIQKIRVLHINTAHSWRGGERQVLNLARSFEEMQAGHQLVICQPGSVLLQKCVEYRIPCMAVAMKGEGDISAALRIKKIVRAFQANVIHAHTAKAHGIAFLVKLFAPEVKLVVTRRVDFPIRKNFLSQIKYNSSKVSAIIAISQNVKNRLLQDGIKAEKIHLAYSGIDLAPFKKLPSKIPLKKEFQISGKAVIIGNVAALVDHKDHKTLLEAVALLIPLLEKRHFQVFIVGDGELEDSLKAKAAELGIYQNGLVFFTGFRDDVDAFLSLFDIYVMSSKEEGLGTAVLDAMAAGLPVCATAGGGIPEMIDQNRGGLLTPVGDAEKLAESLKYLILNAEKRKQMGAYNKKRVCDFSMQNTCQETVKVYKKVLFK